MDLNPKQLRRQARKLLSIARQIESLAPKTRKPKQKKQKAKED